MSKFLRFGLLLCLLSFSSQVWAYDFSSAYKGKTIYYNIISSSEVEVTDSGYYSGHIVIPTTVSYKGSQYVVTTISNNAFYDCKNLLSVTLPSTLTYIGTNAFNNCLSLHDIVIPESVKTIKEFAFSECRGLVSIHYNAINCNASINIDRGLFAYCLNVQTIYIGNKVKYIPAYTFSGCKNVLSIICLPPIPPTINKNTFNDISRSAIVIVPCQNANNVSYSDSELWREFSNIQPQENSKHINTSFSICEGETFLFGDDIIDKDSVYETTFENENGCDSIVTLRLIINPVKHTEIFDTICYGETYYKNGFNEKETGSYVDTLQTKKGCDSIITLHLTTTNLTEINGLQVKEINNQIALSWKQNNTYKPSYEIYRNGKLLALTDQNYYIDLNNLQEGETYTYQVRDLWLNCKGEFTPKVTCTFSKQTLSFENINEIIVYNAMQKEVLREKNLSKVFDLSVYMHNLNQGIYFVKAIRFDGSSTNTRIVIK